VFRSINLLAENCPQNKFRLGAAIPLWLLVTSLIISGNASAGDDVDSRSDSLKRFGYFARVVTEFGGDTLVKTAKEDGTVVSRLRAGEGTVWEFGVNFDWRLLERPALETEFAIGFKRANLFASSGVLSFQRVLVSGAQFYRFGKKIRVGAGLTANLLQTMDDSTSTFLVDELRFENALGLSVMMEYRKKKSAFGVRATYLQYKYESEVINADGFGIYYTRRYY